jgi:hypothetical protein
LPEGFLKKGYPFWDRYDCDLQLAIVEAALNKTAMTTSTHRHHGYELVLHRKSDDRYQVIIFDPKGNRIASTEIHLERQGALTEASEYVDHLIAKRRALPFRP